MHISPFVEGAQKTNKKNKKQKQKKQKKQKKTKKKQKNVGSWIFILGFLEFKNVKKSGRDFLL